MQALVPCEFGAISILVVASQAARLLRRRESASLVVGVAAVTGVLLTARYGWLRGVSHSVGLLAGGIFAAFAVELARRVEEQSRVHERMRLARELHDVLGHDLTALGLQLEVATHVAPDRAATHVAKAKEVTARLLLDVREVAAALRGEPPADLGPALREITDGAAGMNVHLAIPDELRVADAARGRCLLRCVQEIVTNAMRHARAANLWITITVDDGAV
jgi:signal transduction histidine kinase